MLGWALFVPLGFILDPLFHAIGLEPARGALAPGAVDRLYNTPLVPYTNFNNTRRAGQRGRLAGAGGARSSSPRAGAWPAIARRSARGCSSRSSTRRSWRRRCTTSTASSGRSEPMAVKIFRWKAIGPLLLFLVLIGDPAVALRRAGGEGHDRGGGHRAARHPGGRRQARHHRQRRVGGPARAADRRSLQPRRRTWSRPRTSSSSSIRSRWPRRSSWWRTSG